MNQAKKDDLKIANYLKRQKSEVALFSSSGSTLPDVEVWCDIAPSVRINENILFAKCRVKSGSTKDTLKLIQIDPPGKEKEEFEAKISNVWNCNSSINPLEIDDISMLPHGNIACVLDFLKSRYLKDYIYTSVELLLVVINPFRDLKNTDSKHIDTYHNCDDYTKLPPHIFLVARKAHDNFFGVGKSQTIIVSGESGAGKTEATKHMMKYFSFTKNGAINKTVQSKMMAANPILESFGNSKTIRNDNSSRFGRFMQFDVNKGGGIMHGSVIAFLLEKSRVLTQCSNERSFHIFYQLCKGADAKMKSRLKLKDLNEYKYLNPHCYTIEGVDDSAKFLEVINSFSLMNLREEEINTIFSIVSGVLLMGNVKIGKKSENGVEDAAIIEQSSESTFQDACDLLFLNADNLRKEITIKITQAGKNKVESRWNQNESDILKSSLVKAMYEKLFLWIIRNLNKNIKPEKEFNLFIGMLDIFGFEVFQNNSLEQLLINITNEMMQKNFIQIIFENESKLFSKEGIANVTLSYNSNSEVIDILTDKKLSVLSTLEDQCLVAGGTDEKIVSSLNNFLASSSKYIQSKLDSNKQFTILHTIGEIHYNVEGFIFKNKDLLRPEIMDIINQSSNKIVSELFEGIVMQKGKLSKGFLIGSQFMNQLTELMNLINSTELHFVRCVKPNENKKPLEWDPSKIIIQLHALSIIEAIQLRKLGYSYRRLFKEFINQFRFVDLKTSDNENLLISEATKLFLQNADIPSDSYAIGNTMVFLKPSAVKKLNQIQREKIAHMEAVVKLIECIYLKLIFRKNTKKKNELIIRLQSHLRRQLVDI